MTSRGPFFGSGGEWEAVPDRSAKLRMHRDSECFRKKRKERPPRKALEAVTFSGWPTDTVAF